MIKTVNWLASWAMATLGLTLGFISLWNQSFFVQNHETRFITQSIRARPLPDNLIETWTGSTGSVCGDGILTRPEECENSYQCAAGFACVVCQCQSISGNWEANGGFGSSSSNDNPNGMFSDASSNSAPNWGFNFSAGSPSWTGSTGFIDLSLEKELVRVGSGPDESYQFTITIKNNGNVSASNFIVKDYIPSNWLALTIGNGWVQNWTTITWAGLTLDPNQTLSLSLSVTKTVQWDSINKAEICGYLWSNSVVVPHDPDSNPCDMGPSGISTEDDEDVVNY